MIAGHPVAVGRRGAAPEETSSRGAELRQGGKSSACCGGRGRVRSGGYCLGKETGDCSNSRSNVIWSSSLEEQADIVTVCSVVG